MIDIPPNTNKVAPEHDCDICRTQKAIYYNLTYYIHICSVECFNRFEQGYNGEIDSMVFRKLEPDTKDESNEV